MGHSYDITGYNVKNQTTHLIGDKDTEITECEVYKISFIWIKILIIVCVILLVDNRGVIFLQKLTK